MTYTNTDKLKALAIVGIFETSRPMGDYAACVVLNDGAGVSYGISQFTHRSGSLGAVVEGYLKAGGQVGRDVLTAAMPLLQKSSLTAISRLAADEQFKRALRAAAATPEMRSAQQTVTFSRYLGPAITICERRGFVLPLSLAVVYDSVTHGSWERIAARVASSGSAEKAWMIEYVRKRHYWLTIIPRLRVTAYRTKFFLDQIAIGNWDLNLPLNVHGVRLGSAFAAPARQEAGDMRQGDAGDGLSVPPASAGGTSEQTDAASQPASTAISTAVQRFDQVEGAVTGFVRRTDSAKSLWTTVGGTLWQAAWAVFGFITGLPRVVWIVVAVIAASLMLAYLYRQIELGKIRELAVSREQLAVSGEQ
ncbi:MAG: chitosanase [Pyrinomonadaceae bacterium]